MASLWANFTVPTLEESMRTLGKSRTPMRSWSLMVRGPTLMDPAVQSKRSLQRTNPFSRAAAAATILNVEPGS